jgi:membrane protein DedA with SNARE-associated domain
MDFVQFSMLTLGGSLVRSAFLICAGYAFGENYAQVQVWMSKYEHVVLPIILACIIVRIGHKIYRKYWGKK